MIQWMVKQEVLDVTEFGYPDHPMDHVNEVLENNGGVLSRRQHGG